MWQGRRQVKKCGVDMHGERAECELITAGVWRWNPQWGPGTELLVRVRGGGKAPLKLKTF